MRRKLLTFGIFLFLSLTASNYSIRYSSVTSVCSWDIGKAFAIRMNDIIDTAYPNANLDTLIELQNSIGKENAIHKVTDHYIQELVYATLTNTEINFTSQQTDAKSIAKEALKLITKRLGNEWERDPKFEENLTEAALDGIRALQGYTAGIQTTLSSHLSITILYSIFTATIYRILFLSAALLFIALSFLLFQKEALTILRNSFFASGITVLMTGILFHEIAWKLSNQLIGRTVDFTKKPFVITGILFFLTGLILFLFIKNRQRNHL